MRKTKIFALIVILLCALCITACDRPDEHTEDGYGDPAEYAGVYYSGAVDGRVFFLYEDGSYETYSVPIDELPQMAESGVFKPWESVGRINFGYIDDEDNFVIDNQLSLYDDYISEGTVDFIKLADEINIAILDELTTMTVPLTAYIGEWENNSHFSWITISQTESQTEYQITTPGSFSHGYIQKGQDYLLLGRDGEKLQVTEDGGLLLEGAEGIYYPIGEERLNNVPHKAFVGIWYNEDTGGTIQFTEDGMYGILSAGMNDDESFNFGITGGYYEVHDGVLTYTDTDDIERTAELNDGVMRISGIDGVFEKD